MIMSGSGLVLVHCLGNICRSTIAEALLRQKWEVFRVANTRDKKKFSDITVDSCSTATYYLGSSLERRGCEHKEETWSEN